VAIAMLCKLMSTQRLAVVLCFNYDARQGNLLGVQWPRFSLRMFWLLVGFHQPYFHCLCA